MVRLKLQDAKEGKGWTIAKCDLAEREYRRFLTLNLLYPDEAIVPCGLVDEIWHAHILDTQAYADDCARVFGYFVHHYPYFGMRGEEDAEALWSAYDQTLTLYEHHFGAPTAGVWRPSDAMSCGRTACKPQKCR
jgi:hypothetical protein